MFLLVLGGTAIAVAIGLGAKFYLDRQNSEQRITWVEFTIATAAILLVIAPSVSYLGTKAAISNQVTFYENWGGYEYEAQWVKQRTYRDGPHRYGYDCDPYTVQVPYECGYTDSKGVYHSKTCYRDEIRYHDCPQCDEEWTFTVRTTLGDYTIADRNLPTNPDEHRWRRSHRVPDHLPSGIPDFWQKAKNRLDAGDPGPVTARRDYENFILASQSSILKKYSDSIDRYLKEGTLPKFSKDVHSFYYEDRAYLVGVTPPGNWQFAINRFNAALGSELQGDLHLVIVDAKRVSDPDNYIGALVAYWQSSAFEKDALSKNAIVVVLGTEDGKTVKWARAKTGMPIGNEMLMLDIQNKMPGATLEPEAILGHPVATKVGLKATGKPDVAVSHTKGALELLLWGEHKFERVCMKCEEEGGIGYKYLKKEIQPTTGQTVAILFGVVFFSMIAWGVCIVVGVPAGRGFNNYIHRGNRFSR